MRHGSLFSGIGGFDLAAEWCGWDNIFHCEWNEFGQKILKHYWPEAITYDDITKTDFTIHRGTIDILTGGFPCQPYSSAGKRLGKEDERHLWPEMLRAIKEIEPRWAVLENVHGLVNWNGGMVFEEVQADLEAEGYEVQPYILPAASVNAPHRRDRVWFVANSEVERTQGLHFGKNKKHAINGINGSNRDATHTERNGLRNHVEPEGQQSGARRPARSEPTSSINGGDVADTEEQRFQERDAEPTRNGTHTAAQRHGSIQDWADFPTVSPVCQRNDGISDRLSGITFPKWRNEGIKAMGNTVVPQVVYQIFKTIELYERTQEPIAKS